MNVKSLIILLLLPIILQSIQVDIPQPQIENSEFVNDLPVLLESGNPKMAYIPLKILLPMGEKLVSVNLEFSGNKEILKNVFIQPAKQIQPISGKFILPESNADPSIYNKNADYPVKDYINLGTQRMNGYEILLINVFPYKYNPVSQTLVWFENARIAIATEFSKSLRIEQNNFLISNSRYDVGKLVENPQNIKTYQKQISSKFRDLPDESDPYSMVIITNDESTGHLEQFVNWKNSVGISCRIFTTSEIYSNYPGVDNAEKIKNFIIDAYQAYSGTDQPLEYVLLGGDDEIIPIRGVFIDTGHGTVDHHLPCDLYYSCLDNDWDENGNGIFGEVNDNVDLIPEIAIGRIPAETETEFNNFFYKTHYYSENSNYSDDVAYLLGENLNWNPLTWGGDYKDEVASACPSFQADYHINTLYDREGTYSSYAVKNAIDQGLNIINHMGHSNESVVFGQNMGSVNSYVNTEYGFAYSQGCYPAAFDEATSQQSESIAENLVIREHGLFAFIGNTRYGWYSPGDTNGPSQPYDIAFFEAIFNDNIRELGKALADSRIVLANEALQNAYLRWVHYELVLFGDPSVPVKNANGNFPMLVPQTVEFNDEQGDSDGAVNPGEEVEIYITLENLQHWANASDVSASISSAENIELIQDQVYYGDIADGETAEPLEPFVIFVNEDCEYDEYRYTLTITAPISEGIEFNRDYELSFSVSLFQRHWPWTNTSTVSSNPIILNINEDETKEIMIVDMTSNINVLNNDAEQLAGFPIDIGGNIWKSTALADIDNDGLEEVIIANRNGSIYAVDGTGEFILQFDNCCEQLLTPIVADMNGDENMEIVSMGSDKSLIVIDSAGDLLDGFPLQFSYLASSEMAVADLNADGTGEIIVPTLDANLYAIMSDGSVMNGFPVALSAPVCGAPIILDNSLIVIGTYDNRLKIIDMQGNELLSMDLSGRMANSAIAADFDEDGELEIAFCTILGDVYILEQSGSELNGWPQSLDTSITNPPLTADINNDDQLDLICLSGMNDLFAYNFDGSEIDFSPVPVSLSGNTPATLDDIDRDGDFEVVAGTANGVVVFDIKTDKGSKIPWHTYRGNYRRTGCYSDNQLITEVSESPQLLPMRIYNYPNPFRNSTNISFVLNHENLRKVSISIYNIKGQKIRELESSSLKSGINRIIWDGKDSNLKDVSSGIYFYELHKDNVFRRKKMIVIKE